MEMLIFAVKSILNINVFKAPPCYHDEFV